MITKQLDLWKLSFQDERQMRAVIGLNKPEFEDLLTTFHQLVIEKHSSSKRQRALGGGRVGKLGGLTVAGSAMKLVFVLIWLRTYPTYDIYSFITKLERSRCQRWVIYLLPILESSLGRKLVLPERKVRSIEEFERLFPGVKDIFIDGAERPIQKPKDQKKKKKLYSGKKKTTTRKVIIATDQTQRILILGGTKTGRRHDKRIAEKQGILQCIPDDVDLWVDTGFQGVQKDRSPGKIHMPSKASKNKPLTEEQKQNNHVIGSFRVVVEHAIGHMKISRAASDTWRGKKGGLDDTVNLIAAGLWNFRLNHKQGIA